MDLNLLIVESRQDDVELILGELQRSGIKPRWDRVDGEPDYVARLQQPELPDVILADDTVPQFSAARALELLQARKLDIPFIVVTGTIDEESAIGCIKQGAADYLMKDRLARLAPAIVHALEEKRVRDDKRRTEEQLQESERQLRLALEAARMMTWSWDISTGRKSESAPGSSPLWPAGSVRPDLDAFLAAVHPDDRRQLEERIWRSVETGTDYSAEFRIPLPDGGVRWVGAKGQVFRDDTGRPIRMAGIGMDITDRKHADHALRASEERYRKLVENAPDAILVTHEHRIIYVNDSGVRLLGASGRKDLIGHDILDFIHPDYHATARHLSERVTEENVASPLVVQQFVRLDGEFIEIELIAMPCVYDGLPAIQGVLRDVSDRRRTQEKARQHLAELAHVTRLRMMGELMSEVSHEINQPLYAISNFAAAAVNRLRSPTDADDAEILSWLEQIAVQANRAGEIIRRIGRFVRKSPAKLATVEVNDIVRNVVGLLSIDGRLDVELSLQLTEPLRPVHVDRIQIEQVLVNLLRNALEAVADNPSADRQLTIRTDSLPSAGVRVAVCDNGRGVAEDELKRLFEPFFTTKTDGMGMGLSISHSIIEAHGGRMEAVPNPDRGLTFQFTLPVASPPTPDGN